MNNQKRRNKKIGERNLTECGKRRLKNLPWREVRTKCALLLGFAGFYGLLSAAGIGCPILFFTGISCAGCGMTRAVFSVLRLDFAGALRMHPLVFTAPFLLFFFLFGSALPKKAVKYFWTGAVLLYGGVYLFRLFTGSPVVTADLRRGFFFRLLGL